MGTKIQTPKLGAILISEHLIKAFVLIIDDVDISNAYDEIIKILQGTDIEEIIPPVPLPRFEVEMWVHRPTGLIFCVLLKDDYRLVSSVIKGEMSDFVFDK